VIEMPGRPRIPYGYGAIPVKAVKATFRRRKTEVPSEPPIALTEEFGRDRAKNIQWNVFIRKGAANPETIGFSVALTALRGFLLPVMNAAAGKEATPGHWKAGGPWNA
jgi:hypothetical protein